jgi:hypothetical protein
MTPPAPRAVPRAAALLALAALPALADPAALAAGFAFTERWVGRSAAAADVDGDGTVDLVVGQGFLTTGTQRGRVLVHYGDPARPGRWASRDELPCGPNPIEVVVRDLDGDLLVDVATASGFDGSVTVLRATPASGFLRSDHPAVGRAVGLAAADLDQDGLADLAVAGERDLAVLFQDGALPGTFLPAAPVATAQRPSCLALGDVDGDALADLVYGVARGVAYRLQDGAAAGTFAPEAILASEARRIERIVASDLDGDGRDDFALAARGAGEFLPGAGLSILLHTPGMGLAFTETAVQDAIPHRRLVVADMDGDAIPDLVATAGLRISWFRQDPAARGTFRRVRGGSRAMAAAEGPLAVADFDGDLLADPMAALFGARFVPRRARKPDRLGRPRVYRSSD